MTITVPCMLFHDTVMPGYSFMRVNHMSTRAVEIPLATLDRWERVLAAYDAVQNEMAKWEKQQNGPGNR